jgi:PAS domain S-box-containing protein
MGAAKNILVVEDERIVARDIQRSLSDLGYDVPATAATAEQAIALASNRCPDLVLMDIRIKGTRDGIETAEILRERFNVPIVYLTAYADATTVERAKRTEPLAYLLKPVKPNELRSAVELALYRHEMERRLRDREHWLATTLRSIGDAVISTDPEGRINYMNPVAETLTGHRLESALGRASRDVLRLVDGRSREPIEDPLEQALRVKRTINVEGTLTSPERGAQTVTDRTSPIIDDRGRILGAVMVFRDVSEQKRLQRRLELADRLASVGAMAAGVAQEVNTPLSVILANVVFALGELKEYKNQHAPGGAGERAQWTAAVETALKQAQTGAERVKRIVADMQAFCRTDPGKADKIDVHQVLERAVDAVACELPPRLRLVKELGAIPAVEAGAVRLGQVFVNILLNAAQAMQVARAGDHELKIATRTDDAGRAVIEVSDTGVGMPPEVLIRAFEPFFTTKDVGQGTGLGLSICHGIVKSLGGEIELESDPARGTLVRVVLPAAPPPAIAAQVSEARRGHVLVVDDEPMFRTALRRLLGEEHALTCPKTSPEALALIDGGMCFDLILCDVTMPELSGVELHQRLLARHPDQARRMVFLTGGALSPEALEFTRTVPNRKVEKPFDSQQLRRLVQELLGEYGIIHREEKAAR